MSETEQEPSGTELYRYRREADLRWRNTKFVVGLLLIAYLFFHPYIQSVWVVYSTNTPGKVLAEFSDEKACINWAAAGNYTCTNEHHFAWGW